MEKFSRYFFRRAIIPLLLCIACGQTTASYNIEIPQNDGSPGSGPQIITSKEIDIKGKAASYSGLNESKVSLSEGASLFLTGGVNEVLSSSVIILKDCYSWVFFPAVSRDQWHLAQLGKYIRIGHQPFAEGSNAELVNYYNGVYVRAKYDSFLIPAVLYRKEDSSGISLNRIYSGADIPVGNDALTGFMLRRGFMMTLAENHDGTGASKVYMATETDLKVDLDDELASKVSFLRVVPWNYVCKRGCGGNFSMKEAVGATWFYSWSIKFESTNSMDYTPMFWGGVSSTAVDAVLAKHMTNHVLAFNEPDGKDQSDLTPQKALELYPAILKTGLRVGSPACREGAWRTWLDEFMNGCREHNYRVDFIAIHWYDWGNWSSTKDPSPANVDAIVNRFKKDIDNCYAKYGLPIWITEFNANKNRLTPIQVEFLMKAIPMLESHPHVERYAYFQPNGGNGDFIIDGQLTQTAKAYHCIPSTPAVK